MLQSCRAWTLCTSTLKKKEDMGRQGKLAASLLILVLMRYTCEAALLRRSSATDFLRSEREKRAARCVNGDCSSENSSESEEMLEANSDYEQENSKMLFPAGSQVGVLKTPFGGRQEGSGM